MGPQLGLEVGAEGSREDTSANSDVVSRSTMPDSPHRSRDTPPKSGMLEPHTPDRPATAVTGTRASWHAPSTAATCSRVGGARHHGGTGRDRAPRWPSGWRAATSRAPLRPARVVDGHLAHSPAQAFEQRIVDGHARPGDALGDLGRRRRRWA